MTTGLLLVLGGALLGPIAIVLKNGLVEEGTWTLYWLREVCTDPLYLSGLWNSVLLATAVTLLCLAISLPIAMISTTYEFKGKSLASAFLQVPLILPPFVGAIGLKGILSRNGGLNSLLASWGMIDPASPIDWLASPFLTCVVLEALYLYPIMYLNLQAALANIDPAIDDAAKDLGAGAMRRFFSITLPLVRPGAFAGGTIVFVWAFTELGTPLMVGFRKVTAVQVFDALQTTNPENSAYALVAILLMVSVSIYVLGRLVLGRRGAASASRIVTARSERPLRGLSAFAALVPFAIVGGLAAMPHVGVILMSISSSGLLDPAVDQITLEHYQSIVSGLWTGGEHASLPAISIVNSLKYSSLAMLGALWLGIPIAFLSVRSSGWLIRLLDGLSMLPLAVPGLVMAFGYFALVQEITWLSFLNPLRHDPMPILVLAYAVRRLPFVVRSCAAGMEQVEISLEEAAHDLGAGRTRTFLRVTLPLLSASVIVAALLVFTRSMLEVSDSLVLAFDRDTYPLTKAIWALSSIPQNGIQMASALGALGMLLLAFTIVIASAILGKRLGAHLRI